MRGKQRAAQGLSRPFRGTRLPGIGSSAGVRVRVTAFFKKKKMRTSDGPVVENLPCHAGDSIRPPGPGRSLMPGSN